MFIYIYILFISLVSKKNMCSKIMKSYKLTLGNMDGKGPHTRPGMLRGSLNDGLINSET